MEQSYKEKYELALSKAKEQYNYPCMRSCMGILEEIFPELAESEDEKVRKELLVFCRTLATGRTSVLANNIDFNKWISWLEKQAERKTPQWMIDFLDSYRRKIGCSLDHDEARDVEGKILCIMQWLEKQGQVKESFISQHEIETCKENNNSLTSEDEKVRKALLEMVHDTTGDELLVDYNVHKEEALAWLEKQGEQIDIANKEYWRGYREGKKEILDKYAEIEKQNEQKYTQRDIDDAYLKGIADVKREVEKIDEQTEKMKKEIAEFIFNSKEDIKQRYEWIKCLGFDVKFSNEEKQGEKKPTDNVEPKFKVGDWIIRSAEGFKHNAYLVTDVKDYYVCEDLKGRRVTFNFNDVHKNFKLWDISDARGGDVLYINNTVSESIMIYKSFNNGVIKKYASYNKFGFEGEHYLTLNDGYITPATKEQRDTLLKAMADAGYTFDFEKKELKKITQKSEENKENIGGISPNSAWSEEDECYMSECIGAIATKDGWSFEEKRKTKHWLKSLQDRVGCEANCTTTKEWSEEDENIMKKVTHILSLDGRISNAELKDINKWLKSLKPQNRWKPSDEHIKVLNEVLNFAANHESPHWNDYIFGTLNNLIRQLKKLMEE